MKWQRPKLIEVHYPMTVTDGRDRDRWTTAMMLDQRLQARTRVILARLALHLNLKTRRCDPSVELLGTEVALHGPSVKRMARRALAEAERRGWIHRTERHGGDAKHKNQTNSYELTIPEDIGRGLQSPLEPKSERTHESEARGLQSPPNTESRTLNLSKRKNLEFDEGKEGSQKGRQPSEGKPFVPINPLPPISARPPSPDFRRRQEQSEAHATLERYRVAAAAANGGGLAAGSSQ
jgi:hypothetical protein